MTRAALRRLIAAGETSKLDFKSELVTDQLWHEVV